MPGTKSKLSLRQRRNRAYKLWMRGYTISEIADRCNVTEQTVNNYLNYFKENLRKRIAEDPDYFDRTIEHTFEELERLQHLEKETWLTYKDTGSSRDSIAALNLIKSIGEQRARLMRLMDVRVEVVTKVERSERVQEQLIEFMREELCGKCKKKLEERLIAAQLGGEERKAIEGEVIEGEVVEEEEAC